ncbi:MAG: restriction endonuclease subunit S, partial [Thermodesulfobacteriota bacterium]|nr:restriction endonuclease subunit S [Thermodesulfobacteriota bacterium]
MNTSKVKYTQTEIGRIPKEWEIVPLKGISEINKESIDPAKEFPDHKFLYIDIDSVENETGVIRNAKEIIGKSAPSRARRLIHQNDVLMSTVRPYLKAFTIVPKKFNSQICSTGFAVLTCGEKLLPLFLLYSLFAKSVLDQCKKMMVGGQYPALTASQVSNIEVLIPPLPEQKKIAEILSTVDEAIEKVGQAIEKTQKLKKGLLQTLLAKGIQKGRFKIQDFKDTEIGRIPREWEVNSITEVGTLQYGITKTAIKVNTGVRFLRITDITDEGVKWDGVPYCELTKNELEKYELKCGDILFARIGATTGKTCFIEKAPGSVFGSYLLRMQPLKGIDTKFLFFFTQSPFYWKQVNAVKGGQLKGGLNTKLLGNIKFPLPPLSEQQKVA